jgi:trehalose 6-phosphate phosphatase
VNELDALRTSPATTGVFLDFDGTLSDIVARPELARAADGAPEALARCASTFALVAIVSGRPSAEVRARLDVPGVEVFGLYGLEEVERPDGASSRHERLLAEVHRAVADVEGARVEDKGASVAVHYRGAADEEAAEHVLRVTLREIASRHRMVVLPGKMVFEIAPSTTPGKGALVQREARGRGLTAVLYAGDDVADIDAFAALDRLWGEGTEAVKVAVDGPESPQALLDAADVVVDGPAGLVALLRDLVRD